MGDEAKPQQVEQQCSTVLDQVPPASRACWATGNIYGAIAADSRLSSGAFRLWHVIHHHALKENNESFPGYSTIRTWTGCDVHSIPGWIRELVDTGWLMFKSEKATKSKHGWRYRYLLMDGQGHPFYKTKTDGEIHVTVTGKSTTVKRRGNPRQWRRGNPQQTDVKNPLVTNTCTLKECSSISRDTGVDSGCPSTNPPAGTGPAAVAPAVPRAKRRINSFPDDDEPLPCDIISRGGAE